MLKGRYFNTLGYVFIRGLFQLFNTLVYLTYLIFCDFRESIVQPSYDNGLQAFLNYPIYFFLNMLNKYTFNT
nr:MAG TPA: hypothetical protein [Caudoviricetes sp.]